MGLAPLIADAPARATQLGVFAALDTPYKSAGTEPATVVARVDASHGSGRRARASFDGGTT